LNINLNINKEKQYCKIDAVCGAELVGRRRVKEGDYCDGIRQMDFINLHETELRNFFQLL
jgi:hypothetical protein